MESPAQSPVLATRLGPLELRNPVMNGSGCFGHGTEMTAHIDYGELGAFVTKTVTLRPRPGNPPPRGCEVEQGMLNSIGLENKGVEAFIDTTLPGLLEQDVPLIVNLGGDSNEDFAVGAEMLTAAGGIDAIEMNLSCPNVHGGRLPWATDAEAAETVVRQTGEATDLPLFVKLSPNALDRAAEIGQACEAVGAAGLVVFNTLLALSIDWRARKTRLGSGGGGLSGPALMPVSLFGVWTVSRAVDIPVIGSGGIACADDALQFLVAGAAAVQVGTANFADPTVMPGIAAGMAERLEEEGTTVNAVIGTLMPPDGGDGAS